MAEHVAFQTVLNAPKEAPPPLHADASNVPEHALSLGAALDSVDSTDLPMPERKMVSEKFKSLDLGEDGRADVLPSSQPTAHSTTSAPRDTHHEGAEEHVSMESSKREKSSLSTLEEESIPPTVAMPTTPTKVVPSPAPRRANHPGHRIPGSTESLRKDDAAAAAAARERDIAAAFAGLPQVRSRWQHNYLKILLVGENGLGKTTLVRNLFAAYASDVDFPVADASESNATGVFASHPERLCTELMVKDEDGMVWWHYLVQVRTSLLESICAASKCSVDVFFPSIPDIYIPPFYILQDTPGYGDFDGPEDAEAQRAAILSHIRSCSLSYLDGEMDPNRKHALQATADPRIDVCLYFLPPHRMRKTDGKFMRELSAMVPVVPVLAKADAMTSEELIEFRHTVKTATHRATAGSGWRFSKDALDAAGARHGPPFAVVAAATVDRTVGRFWPVRKYPWGRCESLLTAHSELPALRRLLFETGYWELKTYTERRYLEFRRVECAARENPIPRPLRPLFKLAVAVALTVGATFVVVNGMPFVRDETIRRETVRRVKGKVSDVMDHTVGVVQEAHGRAEEVAKVAKSAAGAAVETGKRSVKEAASKLEAPAVRTFREDIERSTAKRQRPWWRFFG